MKKRSRKMGSVTSPLLFLLLLVATVAAVAGSGTGAAATMAATASAGIPNQPQQLIRLSRNPQRRLHLAQDLHFTEEPPRQLQFTNTSGAVVDCVAKGVPNPTITWTFADGRPLSQVGGLLQVAENGSLVFPPFPAHRYDTRVHSAVYTCRATSPVGTLLATPTIVRAVVVGHYQVQVYDHLVMTGNTAVLQCVVPSYLREFVSVTSWQLEDSRHVYPSLHGDGKYHMTEAGDLHVLEVTPADGLARFRCRALHHLTGKSQVSVSPARIIVTEAQGAVAPRMRESGGRLVVESGASVTLPCVAQGHPPPSYSWYRGSEAVGGGDVGGGVWIVGGSLVLERADTSHAGQYSCMANNTAGQARMPVHLQVIVPLSVQVTPRQVQVDAGGRLELKCHVSGSPVEAVTWYKDGKEVRPEGRVSLRPRDTLRISLVVASDAGLYQCAATHAHQYAHAHAHVTLGAAPPQLLYRFIEQTLQPGPAVSLKCIAAGTPTPHITWALDGFPLPHSHRLVKGQYVSAEGDVISHVNISSVHVADGGAYTCTAANSAGEASHVARLNVYGPPQVRPMGQQTAVAGRTFIIACPASGHPIHSITWTKDGSPLPRNYRQRVLANGTLVVQEVIRGADDGRYSCTASSRSGRADTQSLQLRVLVPPSLAPLTFPAGTRAGMQIRATCLVQEGDQPVRYAWTKDSRPLDARLGVRTSQLDAFTSILVIERAAAQHSGNYTCTASNAAASSATTARLTVNVPPTWVVEPSSTSVALGGSLALHCLARGFPDPITTWRRQAASGEFVGVVEGTGSGESSIVQWKNGTLWIGRSARGHEGRYLCEAGNGVPPGLSKLVDITVNEPPWFRATGQRQEVRVGGAATLTCHAHGDAPLTLTWNKDAVSLPPLPRYQVSRHEEQDQGGTISKLVVTDAHLEDSGTFSCTASNTHGVRTSHLHLLVQDVPGPPSGVEVEEVGPQHLVLTWTSPQDSNAPITAYIITLEPQSSTGTGAAREERVGGQERRLVLKGLTPATQYSLRVAAENRVGRGRSSPPVVGSTEEQPPSAPPRGVTLMAVSSSALRVSWEPPPYNTTHGTLLGYHLGYKLVSDAEGSYNFTRVGGVGSIGVTSARVSGLNPHTRYSVVLRAFNSKGTGPASPPAIAVTLEDKPSAPPGRVRCDGVSSSSLVVTWTPPPPSQRNGIVTSYRVAFWKTEATEDGSEEAAMMSKGLRAQLENLRPWTNYSVSVAASTRAGQGVTSSPLICTTHQDVPEAPAMVKAVASGPRAAVVSWAPPTYPHGRLTRYTIYWKAAGSGSGGEISRRVDPQLTHVTLHDLSHVAHKVWVTAATRKGEGPPSSVVMVKPSHSVAAGVWSVGGNVTAAWREDVSLPCGAVGMPEPTLAWTQDGVSVHANKARVVVQRDGTLSLSDLQRDDGGLYTCTATNRNGHDSAVYHLTVLVPPSPPSLHVIETTTSSVRVQWNVEDTGGATLQGSSLHYRVAGDQWTQVAVTGDQRTYTTHNLRCGSLHHFYVTVHNHVGRSEPSKTESARTKGRPPQSPPKFQFVTTNSSQATLYLSQWIDGGCPITHFSVEYRKKSIATWTTVGTEIPPARTFSLGGLEPGHHYQLRVTAHNTAGSTPAEYSITTPSLGHSVAADSGVSVWGGAPSTSSAWQELRVVVPAAVSTLTLLLTLTTVFVCLRKRSPARTHQKGSPETVIGTTEKIGPQEELYTTVRRPAPSPPQQQQQQQPQQQQQESREALGDYPRDELYHYAAATYRVNNGTPPPPAPPSPPTHAHRPLSRGQKAFTALVYQAPSLHDVDCPNLQAEGDGRVPWPGASPPQGPLGAADSQSEGYGSLMSPRGSSPPAPGPPHHRHPAKHPRAPRTCVRNVRFP